MKYGPCLAVIPPLGWAVCKFAVARASIGRYHGSHDAQGMRAATVSREDIMRRLELLRIEHRDLDSAIAALVDAGSSDQMQIARLKKRKLRLKDEISALEDELVPDIIA